MNSLNILRTCIYSILLKTSNVVEEKATIYTDICRCFKLIRNQWHLVEGIEKYVLRVQGFEFYNTFRTYYIKARTDTMLEATRATG